LGASGARRLGDVGPRCYKRLMSSTECRECRAGLEHCHGTVIRHWLHRSECTDEDCAGPELLPHVYVVDCDVAGCDCAQIDVPAAFAI
jgi:hypothetical protein